MADKGMAELIAELAHKGEVIRTQADGWESERALVRELRGEIRSLERRVNELQDERDELLMANVRLRAGRA